MKAKQHSTHKTRDTVLSLLKRAGVEYRHLKHAESRTSEESRNARAAIGEKNAIGAKALLLRCKMRKGTTENVMVVLPAALRLDSRGLHQNSHIIKSTRFATAQELAELTDGLVPGSVPPFGSNIFKDIQSLYVDSSLLRANFIAFNVGLLTESIVMCATDYLEVAEVTMLLHCSK